VKIYCFSVRFVFVIKLVSSYALRKTTKNSPIQQRITTVYWIKLNQQMIGMLMKMPFKEHWIHVFT